ncbi:MAG: hypothetical protein ACJ79K_01015 [Gemmatimonadaceae bacterium]
MSVGALTPRRAVRVTVVAALATLTACASFGGMVSTRSNVVGGVITEDEMRMTLDTVVRNACEEMGDIDQVVRGQVSVRVSQDVFDDVISARVVKSSGNQHIDATVVDLASLLPPRFRDKAQQVYTPRYDMAVHYTCVRDAYGITGRAAVSL